MCTLVILRRPGHRWPLILAANRDEMMDRPWLPPGRHWPDRGNVVAGLDRLAGGSWLGLNDEGVVAGVMNRKGALGPAPGKRSRGELVLEALDHGDAAAAAAALAELEPGSYQPFNMAVADNRDAYWLRYRGDGGSGGVEVMELPAGLSMITAYDRNDRASPRIRAYLPRFEAAPPPEPAAGDWSHWEGLLASRACEADADEEGAMAIVAERGFGTSSSALIALPSVEQVGVRPIWRFAAGRPGEAPFETVVL
jgi:hypothetical protein